MTGKVDKRKNNRPPVNEPGRLSNDLKQVRKEAKLNGMLPHEFLCHVSQGHMVQVHRLVIEYYRSGVKKGLEKKRSWVAEDYYPTFSERMDAAKSVANYYTPKLATQMTKPGDGGGSTDAMTVLSELAGKLPS